MTHRFTFILFLLLSIPLRGNAEVVKRDEARKDFEEVQRLQFHLENVADAETRERILKGTVFLALVGYLGGVYIAQDRLGAGPTRDVALGVVGLTGGLFGITGLLTMILPSAAEYGAEEYARVPAKNALQWRVKRIRGEARLRYFANRARLSNRIIGGLFTTVGVASLTWFLATGSNNQLNFLGYTGGLYTTLGLILFFNETPAEYEYNEYMKGQKVVENKEAPEFSILPQPQGIGLGMRFPF